MARPMTQLPRTVPGHFGLRGLEHRKTNLECTSVSLSLVVLKLWWKQQDSHSSVLFPFKLFLRHLCAPLLYFHLFYTAVI
jgi:hypothetical protein